MRMLRDRMAVYPLRCAMHGAVNLWTRRWGYVCFKAPTYVFGRWWPWYLYVSPNATPWAASWGIGPGFERGDRTDLAMRRAARASILRSIRAMDHKDWMTAAEAMERGESVVLHFHPTALASTPADRCESHPDRLAVGLSIDEVPLCAECGEALAATPATQGVKGKKSEVSDAR